MDDVEHCLINRQCCNMLSGHVHTQCVCWPVCRNVSRDDGFKPISSAACETPVKNFELVKMGAPLLAVPHLTSSWFLLSMMSSSFRASYWLSRSILARFISSSTLFSPAMSASTAILMASSFSYLRGRHTDGRADRSEGFQWVF